MSPQAEPAPEDQERQHPGSGECHIEDSQVHGPVVIADEGATTGLAPSAPNTLEMTASRGAVTEIGLPGLLVVAFHAWLAEGAASANAQQAASDSK